MSVYSILTTNDPDRILHQPLSPQARDEIRDMQSAAANTTIDIGRNDLWSCVWG